MTHNLTEFWVHEKGLVEIIHEGWAKQLTDEEILQTLLEDNYDISLENLEEFTLKWRMWVETTIANVPNSYRPSKYWKNILSLHEKLVSRDSKKALPRPEGPPNVKF